MTGIDRVEAAYLRQLVKGEDPVFGLLRSAAGYLLLGRAGMTGFLRLVEGGGLPRADLLSRVTNRDPLRARAETAVRRLAMARCPRPLLGRMLRRHLHGEISYLNTGHSNLSVLPLLAKVPGLARVVLLHDTIPLDYPQFARPDTVAPFRAKLALIAHGADLVIHTTQDARARSEAQMALLGRVPAGVVANLGVDLGTPGAVPPGLTDGRPYFVTLGTIEPRKNHALLLDVWQALADRGAPVPLLLILGRRGWNNAAVFARLDALPKDGPVREVAGLNDAAVAGLLQGAAGFLFPSFAEGFGLPPLEAAALGCPVIASNLNVTRELLGDYAVYLDVSDSYSWMETIVALEKGQNQSGRQDNRKAPPTWEAHFKTVLNLA